MPPTGRTKAIQNLVDKANESIGKEAWFDAERSLDRALAMSHGRHDYQGMAEVLNLLHQTRTGWQKQAFASRDAVRVVDDEVEDTMEVEQGRYLVQPPLVGADARRLRLLALASGTPAIVVCREPNTQLGLIPVVAIGPLGAIRAKVKPPKDPMKPPVKWFRDAFVSLGDVALEKINPIHIASRKLEAILSLLDTLPESGVLYEQAIALCLESANEEA
jgi:hypothetical protein